MTTENDKCPVIITAYRSPVEMKTGKHKDRIVKTFNGFQMGPTNFDRRKLFDLRTSNEIALHLSFGREVLITPNV